MIQARIYVYQDGEMLNKFNTKTFLNFPCRPMVGEKMYALGECLVVKEVEYRNKNKTELELIVILWLHPNGIKNQVIDFKKRTGI